MQFSLFSEDDSKPSPEPEKAAPVAQPQATVDATPAAPEPPVAAVEAVQAQQPPEQPTVSMLSTVVKVPEHSKETFDKLLVTLNRKAAKFNLPEITITAQNSRMYVREVSAEGNHVYTASRPYEPLSDDKKFPPLPIFNLNEIEINYPIIKNGDWEIVGKLEAITGSNLGLTYKYDDPESVKATMAYSDCPINCEHCNIKQKRKESFVLKNNETGEFKQVGTSCLEDFTGIDPSKALFLHKAFTSFKVYDGEYDDEAIGFGGKTSSFSLSTYIAAVSFLTEQSGFVSRKTAEEKFCPSTSDQATSLLMSAGKGNEKLWDKFKADYAKHSENSKAVIEWVKNKEMTQFDSFFINLKRIFEQTDIKIFGKESSFSAAAVAMYHREHNAALEKASRPPSAHVGAAGDKMSADLKLVAITPFFNSFGGGSIVQFTDKDFNKLVWKTAACPQDVKDNKGKCLTAGFKVKSHSDYKGENQTEITHLKVTSWLAHDIHNSADPKNSPAEPETKAADAPTSKPATYPAVAEKTAQTLAVALNAQPDKLPLLEFALGMEDSLDKKWPGFPRRSAKLEAIENLENRAMHCLESGDQSDFDIFKKNTGMDVSDFLSNQTDIAKFASDIENVPIAEVKATDVKSTKPKKASEELTR